MVTLSKLYSIDGTYIIPTEGIPPIGYTYLSVALVSALIQIC